MRDLRLLVLTTSFPLTPDLASGIFVARLIEALPATTAVTVVTPAGRRCRAVPGNDRLRIRLFRYGPRRWQRLAHEPGGIPVALTRSPWLYVLVPAFLVSMWLSCMRHSRAADVIHANWSICGLIGGLAGRLMNVPVVTTLRGEDVTRARKSLIDRLLLSASLRLSDGVVTVSDAIRRWVCEQYPRHSSKVQLIENGVDDNLLTDTREVGHGRMEMRLVTVGSLIPRKGLDQLLKALAIARASGIQATLTVVGDGPERGALEQLTKSLELETCVQFQGGVAPAEVGRQLASADVFVLASHSEGRPNAVLEAMAAGLPVVATDVEGVNELVVHERNGLLFRDGDPAGLAASITRLHRDPALGIQLGVRGREHIVAQGLLWANTAKRYWSLYQSVRRS